jgi:hypothetical protein
VWTTVLGASPAQVTSAAGASAGRRRSHSTSRSPVSTGGWPGSLVWSGVRRGTGEQLGAAGGSCSRCSGACGHRCVAARKFDPVDHGNLAPMTGNFPPVLRAHARLESPRNRAPPGNFHLTPGPAPVGTNSPLVPPPTRRHEPSSPAPRGPSAQVSERSAQVSPRLARLGQWGAGTGHSRDGPGGTACVPRWGSGKDTRPPSSPEGSPERGPQSEDCPAQRSTTPAAVPAPGCPARGHDRRPPVEEFSGH